MDLDDWIRNEGTPMSRRDLQRMWDACAVFDGEPSYAGPHTPPQWLKDQHAREEAEMVAAAERVGIKI